MVPYVVPYLNSHQPLKVSPQKLHHEPFLLPLQHILLSCKPKSLVGRPKRTVSCTPAVLLQHGNCRNSPSPVLQTRDWKGATAVAYGIFPSEPITEASVKCRAVYSNTRLYSRNRSAELGLRISSGCFCNDAAHGHVHSPAASSE